MNNSARQDNEIGSDMCKKVHIICAKCGSAEVNFKLNVPCPDNPQNLVSISCSACGELTGVVEWSEFNSRPLIDSRTDQKPSATKADFDGAAQRLLGDKKYHDPANSGYTRPDFCREIAQDEFVDNLFSPATKEADLNVIRRVADRLWKGDGCTGLE